METITKAELTTLLGRYADSDIRYARKGGAVTICQTKLGNVDLTYDVVAKRFSAYDENCFELFAGYNGPATRKFLIENVYAVMFENTEVVD